MSSKQSKIEEFDPNGIGLLDGNVFGLPFSFEESEVVILPAPWDLTSSFGRGSANAPSLILSASRQVDLFLKSHPRAWESGFYMLDVPEEILSKNNQLSSIARELIRLLEAGETASSNSTISKSLHTINLACEEFRSWVFEQSGRLINSGKKVILVGGDHSCSLGFLQAVNAQDQPFGILQIDAHADLRPAYQGFEQSHASIMHNAMKLDQVERLTQVGLRDLCEQEYDVIQSNAKIEAFFDENIQSHVNNGNSFADLSSEIIDSLPDRVYLSIDLDGLDPSLCPNTGTPVPGGLSYAQFNMLIKELEASGKEIVGMDLCETGDGEFDANVSARILYRLCALISS